MAAVKAIVPAVETTVAANQASISAAETLAPDAKITATGETNKSKQTATKKTTEQNNSEIENAA